MAPPPFADLGKSARDLFSKGYHHGFIKFDSTTNSGGTEFKNSFSHNIAQEKMVGNVEVKYKLPDFTITEKWNTENNLGTILEVKDKLCKDSKVTLDVAYNPHGHRRNALLKTEWFNDNIKANVDLNLLGGPLFNVSAVGLFQPNCYLGGALKYDVATKQLRSHNIAFGHLKSDYCLHSYVTDGKEYGGSLYHKVNKNFELGSQFSWNHETQQVRYGFASKYRLNKDTTIQGKVDQSANVALASTHDIGEGLKLTLVTYFPMNKAEAHKFGVGLEFKPCCCNGGK